MIALFGHMSLFLRVMELTLIVYKAVNNKKIKIRFQKINEEVIQIIRKNTYIIALKQLHQLLCRRDFVE